nr:MAG TPA: hypothetical protein [Caudoviricetes sp.]
MWYNNLGPVEVSTYLNMHVERQKIVCRLSLFISILRAN